MPKLPPKVDQHRPMSCASTGLRSPLVEAIPGRPLQMWFVEKYQADDKKPYLGADRRFRGLAEDDHQWPSRQSRDLRTGGCACRGHQETKGFVAETVNEGQEPRLPRVRTGSR
jgi:hypothetical protein